MGGKKSFFVYVLGNGRGALYVGVTNDLVRRVKEHKTRKVIGFTSKYQIDQLLFFEEFKSVTDAISSEKQIKG